MPELTFTAGPIILVALGVAFNNTSLTLLGVLLAAGSFT